MGTPKYSSISLKIFNMKDIDEAITEANSRKHDQFLDTFRKKKKRERMLLLTNK